MMPATAREPGLEFQVLTDPASVQAFEDEWRDLESRAQPSSLAQSFDWCWRGWECVGRARGRQPAVLVGRLAGRAVLVWPLARERGGIVRKLRWLDAESTEYRDVLVEAGPNAGEWIEQAAAELPRLGDVLTVLHLPSESCLRARLGDSLRVGAVLPAPYLDLSGGRTLEDVLAKASRNHRKQIRSRRRTLGPRMRFVRIEDEPALRSFIEWLIEHKVDRLEEVGGATYGAWFRDPRHHAFLEAIAIDASRRGRLVAVSLELDGERVAADLGFLSGERLELLVSGWAPEWARISPARLLVAEVVDRAAELGYERLDFRVGTGPHKEAWRPQFAEVLNGYLPLTPRGSIWVAAVSALYRLRGWR